MRIIDDINLHLEDAETVELAGVHLLLFVMWLARRNFLNPAIFSKSEISSLNDNNVTVDMFMDNYDGKIFDGCVIPVERDFVRAYYSARRIKGWSIYYIDFQNKIVSRERMYETRLKDINLENAFMQIDKRHEQWVSRIAKQKSGWLARLFRFNWGL